MALNSTSLDLIADNVDIDFSSSAPFDDIGLFVDDSAGSYSLLEPVFDDFRIYDGVLSSDELDTEIACTDV